MLPYIWHQLVVRRLDMLGLTPVFPCPKYTGSILV